jgi:hypothetical protein
MLREQTLNDRAEKLDECVAAGSTATEILMGLRWHLRDLLATQPVTEETRSVTVAILTDVESLLERSD